MAGHLLCQQRATALLGFHHAYPSPALLPLPHLPSAPLLQRALTRALHAARAAHHPLLHARFSHSLRTPPDSLNEPYRRMVAAKQRRAMQAPGGTLFLHLCTPHILACGCARSPPSRAFSTAGDLPLSAALPSSTPGRLATGTIGLRRHHAAGISDARAPLCTRYSYSSLTFHARSLTRWEENYRARAGARITHWRSPVCPTTPPCLYACCSMGIPMCHSGYVAASTQTGQRGLSVAHWRWRNNRPYHGLPCLLATRTADITTASTSATLANKRTLLRLFFRHSGRRAGSTARRAGRACIFSYTLRWKNMSPLPAGDPLLPHSLCHALTHLTPLSHIFLTMAHHRLVLSAPPLLPSLLHYIYFPHGAHIL